MTEAHDQETSEASSLLRLPSVWSFERKGTGYSIKDGYCAVGHLEYPLAQPRCSRRRFVLWNATALKAQKTATVLRHTLKVLLIQTSTEVALRRFHDLPSFHRCDDASAAWSNPAWLPCTAIVFFSLYRGHWPIWRFNWTWDLHENLMENQVWAFSLSTRLAEVSPSATREHAPVLLAVEINDAIQASHRNA